MYIYSRINICWNSLQWELRVCLSSFVVLKVCSSITPAVDHQCLRALLYYYIHTLLCYPDTLLGSSCELNHMLYSITESPWWVLLRSDWCHSVTHIPTVFLICCQEIPFWYTWEVVITYTCRPGYASLDMCPGTVVFLFSLTIKHCCCIFFCHYWRSVIKGIHVIPGLNTELWYLSSRYVMFSHCDTYMKNLSLIVFPCTYISSVMRS